MYPSPCRRRCFDAQVLGFGNRKANMALFRKFFYRKPPDGLLEISDRVYVFDCCFSTDVLEDVDYKVYMGGIVGQLRDHFPDASFMVFNFRDGERQSQIASILSDYDMTVMDYPRHYEGCPLLSMEMIHHFLRSSESWLSLGQQNLLLMHCERGGWPVLAFMLACLLMYRKQYTGEQKTLEMIYKQAPRELLRLLSPLNPLPSQLRYLHYVSRRNVGLEWPPLDRALTLDCIILRMLPNFDGEGGCCPIFRIYGQDPLLAADRTPKVLYSTPKKSKIIRHYKQAYCELVKIDIHCHIQGDVVFECICLDDDLEREMMIFRVMFNTAFIRSNILMLNRDEIDILWDAKDRFAKDFRAEVLFSEMDAADSVITVELPIGEEKGLPVEAFAKIQEIFSFADWLDPKADAALNVLQQINTSNIVLETVDVETNILLTEVISDKLQEKLNSSSESATKSTAPNKESVVQLRQSPEPHLTDKKVQPQELPVAFQQSAQSKIISQHMPQSSLFHPVSYQNSPQGSPLSMSRYHSAPSSLGISYGKAEVMHPTKTSSSSRATSSSVLPKPVSPNFPSDSLQRPPFPVLHSSLVSPTTMTGAVPLPPPPPPPMLVPRLGKNQFSSGSPPHSDSLVSDTTDRSSQQTNQVSSVPTPPSVSGSNFKSSPPPPPPAPPVTNIKSSLQASVPPTPTHISALSAPSVPPPPPIMKNTAGPLSSPSPPPPPPLPALESGVGPPHPPPPPFSGAISSTVSETAPPPPPSPGKSPTSQSTSHVPPVPPPVPFTKTGGPLPFGPAPPVPFKGRGLVRSASPRSHQAAPKKTLKPLHWLKLNRAVQGSLWAETQKSDETSKPPEFDMSELENLFSAAVPSDRGKSGDKSSRRSSIGTKPDKVQLIDLRRAYNCEIMLTKVKIPLSDLMSSVLALDDSALDVDQVDNLIKFCPSKEEMELLKGYCGEKENLGKCEQFFLELMKVPRVESKLRVFSFKIQFHSQVSELRSNLNIVKSASNEIRNSAKLKRIMQTILSLGNALNQGTARGSAIGFRLDSLLKLTDTRAQNNKMTLMHYLCKVLAEKLPELLDFHKDLVSLEVATKIQLKYLAEEMQAISKGLEKVEEELTASENDGPVSHTFRTILKEFLSAAEGEVRSLTALYSGVGRNADALALYFGEDPARCPFEQVVSTLMNFVRMFGRAHEENCKQLEIEKKRTQKEAENEKTKNAASQKESELTHAF